MTVREIKKILSQMPDDMEVVRYDGESYALAIKQVGIFNVNKVAENQKVNKINRKGTTQIVLIN